MSYQIESIDLFARLLPPGRAKFVIGKAGRVANEKGDSRPEGKRRPGGFLVARAVLTGDSGRRAIGAAGDRPSYGWLDKRETYSGPEKKARLFDLIQSAQKIYLANPKFDTPFAYWRRCYREVQEVARETDHESLSGSFASALFERAVIDAYCRLHEKSIFDMLHAEELGIDPGAVYPELKDIRLSQILPSRPLGRFHIRHTVGLADPIANADLPTDQRINDGEPETLEEYVRRDGLRYFKVKISGDPKTDLDRLSRIWDVVVHTEQPVITLDGNESYGNIEDFVAFVNELETRETGLFQHIIFIEQPLTRALTHDPATKETIRALAQRKPLVIDEADGHLGAFPNAFDIGYDGVSHKNCKGFFKSMLNYAWTHHLGLSTGRLAFMSGEDLSLMPIVPLHQDFAALGVLGIDHCERNGHHYTYGLPFLTDAEKQRLAQHHPDTYTQRGDEWFLNIQDGQLVCRTATCRGFGTCVLPDWEALTRFSDWRKA